MWKGDTVFSTQFAKAAKRSLGERGPATRLLTKWYPSMTPSCIKCHVDAIVCGADHCIAACRDTKSFDCKNCINTHCIRSYTVCVGFGEDELPLPPPDWM